MIRELRKSYLRKELPFCPGCGNGIFVNCLFEAFVELNIDFHKTVFVSGIGCAAWTPNPHFDAETIHTTHGRAVAIATGIKLSRPNLRVVVISGDGDLTTIGGNHLIHAVRRNIPITVICLNNFIYGMTGGQAGATTPQRALTSTTLGGNSESPFDLVKLVLGAGGRMVGRWPLAFPRSVVKGLKKALLFAEKGFAFSEIVSPCFTQYGRRNVNEFTDKIFKSPADMLEWQKKKYVLRGKKTHSWQIEFGEWDCEDSALGGEACEKK